MEQFAFSLGPLWYEVAVTIFHYQRGGPDQHLHSFLFPQMSTKYRPEPGTPHSDRSLLHSYPSTPTRPFVASTLHISNGPLHIAIRGSRLGESNNRPFGNSGRCQAASI